MGLPQLSTQELSIGAGSALVGGVVGYIAGKRGSPKRRKYKARSSRKRHPGRRKLKFGSKAFRKKYLGKHRRHKQKQPHTAGKRRDTSTKRIRYTKNNQPYIILANGRARFISKKSVHNSRQRRGGRY